MFNSKFNRNVHWGRTKDVGARHCPNYAYHTFWAYQSSCIMLDQRSVLLGGANHVGLHSEEL